jgi:hypothetical protein
VVVDSGKFGALTMRVINSLSDAQIVLKELLDWKDNQISKAKDQRGLQIKNAGDATDPADLVTLRQLKDFFPNIKKKIAAQTTAGGGAELGQGEFSFQAENVGANPGVHVAVNDFSVDITQYQRVNFCYTPTTVSSSKNLIVNIVISSDFGKTWSVLETMTVAVGSQISWPTSNPPINRTVPYSGSPPYRTLFAGDLLNFTIESGNAKGLTIKMDTKSTNA